MVKASTEEVEVGKFFIAEENLTRGVCNVSTRPTDQWFGGVDYGTNMDASPDGCSPGVTMNLHNLSKDSANVLTYLLVHGPDLKVVDLERGG